MVQYWQDHGKVVPSKKKITENLPRYMLSAEKVYNKPYWIGFEIRGLAKNISDLENHFENK